VVVEKVDAYERLAPPLLNRFEKQVLERSDVLEANDQFLLKRLQDLANRFAVAGAATAESAKKDSGGQRQHRYRKSGGATQGALRATFCGWHSDFLSSLLLATRARQESVSNSFSTEGSHKKMAESATDGSGLAAAPVVAKNLEESELFATCWEQLLWLACPERVCRVLAQRDLQGAIRNELGLDLRNVYFRRQQHSSLPVLANTMLEEWTSDGVGASVMVATHSPLASDVTHELTTECPWLEVTHVALHELDQERDLRQKVNEFFEEAQDGAMFLLQCDPLGTGTRRVEHAKNILENARAKFVLQQHTEVDEETEKGIMKQSAGKKAPGIGNGDFKQGARAEEFDIRAASQEASVESTGKQLL
jgi:hypothetical protein